MLVGVRERVSVRDDVLLTIALLALDDADADGVADDERDADAEADADIDDDTVDVRD